MTGVGRCSAEQHEVERLAALVHRVAAAHHAEYVVDVGSGQGYVSQGPPARPHTLARTRSHARTNTPAHAHTHTHEHARRPATYAT